MLGMLWKDRHTTVSEFPTDEGIQRLYYVLLITNSVLFVSRTGLGSALHGVGIFGHCRMGNLGWVFERRGLKKGSLASERGLLHSW